MEEIRSQDSFHQKKWDLETLAALLAREISDPRWQLGFTSGKQSTRMLTFFETSSLVHKAQAHQKPPSNTLRHVQNTHMADGRW